MADQGAGRFAGRRVFVTGASGGVGKATVEMFRAEGATVVGVDLRAEGDVRACDVSDPESVQNAVTRAAADLGGLDVVANVAGVLQFRRLEHLDIATWNRHIGVNMTGPMLVSQAALPYLRESKGVIVSVASNAGLRAQPYQSAYSGSKAGLVMVMKSLALELAADGIRVNTVCPGGIETDLPMTAAAEHSDSDIDWGLLSERAGGRYGFMPPAHVAEAILFLASDGAASINGAVLSVDRGATA